MAKPFDAYNPAIAATEKAIKDREAKLAELKEAKEISYSQEKRTDFYYQLGRAVATIEQKVGDQKLAKSKLKKMQRLEKLISKETEDWCFIFEKSDVLLDEIDSLKSVLSLLSVKSIATNHCN